MSLPELAAFIFLATLMYYAFKDEWLKSAKRDFTLDVPVEGDER